ncbi:hypothetical protein AAKU55_000071 [Oxalobacteraceae bacterium GrIS 1.11]
MFSSLRRQLILICVVIVALAMSAVVLVNFITVRSHTLDSLNQQIYQLSQSHAAGITEWVHSKEAAVASMRPAVQDANPMLVVKAAEQSGGFDLAYIGFADKRSVFSQERKRAADYDVTARPWYIKAAAAGGPIITSPYIGASTGKLVVTFADPIGPKGNTTAVAAADVILTVVVANVNSIKPTPNSFAFLFDGDGKVIAHPDAAMTLKSVTALDGGLTLQSLDDTAQSGLSSPVTLHGRDAMVYVTKVEGTDWSLATVVDHAEATQALSAMVISSALTAIAGIVLAGLGLMMLVRRVLVDWE